MTFLTVTDADLSLPSSVTRPRGNAGSARHDAPIVPGQTLPCHGPCPPEGCRSPHCPVAADDVPPSVCSRCGVREAECGGRCASCFELAREDGWELADCYDPAEVF